MSLDLLPPPVSELVRRVSDGWGMTVDHPAAGSFYAVVVLGGLLTADLARPRFLRELIDSGELHSQLIVGLAGERRLAMWERELAGKQPLTTEAEALAWGLRQAGIDEFQLAEAPSSQGRRATTSSAFGWWVRRHPESDGERIAIVTSSIYRVRNHIDVLVRTKTTEIVTASVGRSPSSAWRSQMYLQEIKAAVDGIEQLAKWADST